MNFRIIFIERKRRLLTTLLALAFIFIWIKPSLAYGPPDDPCQEIAVQLAALKQKKQHLSDQLKNAAPSNKPYYSEQIKELLPKIAAKEKELKICQTLKGKNALTTRVGTILLKGTNGDVGLYLKRVDGPVLAGLNEAKDFQPASTIKVLLHLHAMRQVENGSSVQGQAVTLSTQIPWFTNYVKDDDGKDTSCPADMGQSSESLSNSLKQMMQNSDNRRTQAVRVYFGQPNINATARAIGMMHTSYNHRGGCGDGPDGAVARPNHLTLVDAGLLYEGVANGSLLNATTQKSFYSLMAGKNFDFSNVWQDIQKIVNEEAPAGMSVEKKNSFLDNLDVRYKAGGYSLSTGEFRSVAGWAQIPYRKVLFPGQKERPGIGTRDFVFGIFIAKAPNKTSANNTFAAARAELLREEIRQSLKNW